MIDVRTHADAMRAIADILQGFPPEQQLVLIAGELGNVLCKVGPAPNRLTATAMIGSALVCTFDMIDRHFPERDCDA